MSATPPEVTRSLVAHARAIRFDEIQARLGRVLGGGHYAIGFHSTGTIGTFGAAAACAHLLQLDEDGWLRALGLAGTQAAGLKSGFGTMAKPLHAGRAAANGYLAATLAAGHPGADNGP